MELAELGVAEALEVQVGPEEDQVGATGAHLRNQHRHCKMCPNCLCTNHRSLRLDSLHMWKHPPMHSNNTSRWCPALALVPGVSGRALEQVVWGSVMELV